MNVITLQKAVANLNWHINFYEFCREILQKHNWTDRRLEKDAYCLEKWRDWQKLNKALHLFDDETLERIVTVYERRHKNK
ncbi:hypothetical protein [Pleurocapsa sp. FMAR1]|uniref:hypothetical protein n=1 Tax=Pleurocapsa sp. FMAR1 TaxID=3040204 RepID=UPI0029C772FD|nr:hypothetical protein [Pleurocapsa sp. FMAR1]